MDTTYLGSSWSYGITWTSPSGVDRYALVSEDTEEKAVAQVMKDWPDDVGPSVVFDVSGKMVPAPSGASSA